MDAYLTVLEQDFASIRDQLDAIEPVLETPAERSAFLRLNASGLESSGDRVAAFAAYQELASANDACPVEELEAVKPFWSVRCERLVRGHLERLHEAALDAGDQNAAAEMERRVIALWEQMNEKPLERGALERFVAHYGGFTAAQESRLKLAQLRAEDGDWLAAEVLLMDIESGTEPKLARQAWAQHAKLLVSAGRPDDAAMYYERLAGEWADADCGLERTGRQWVEELPPDHAVRQLLAGGARFPEGAVEATEKEADFNPNSPRSIVDIDGSRGPFYRSSQFLVGQAAQRNTLALDDGLGNRVWEVPLADPQRPELQINVPNLGLSQGRVYGHLTLIAYGFNLFAVDGLGNARQGEPRVLWRADLMDALPGMVRMNGIIQQQLSQRFAPPRQYAIDQGQRRIGNTACLGEIGLVYQRGRTLCCASPVTGDLQWTRDDVPPGSELFGDGEVLCVLPPASQEVLLFDAVDGHELGRRPSVPPENRVLTSGRCILSWVDMGDRKCELRCQDIVLNRQRWFQPFDAQARGWIVDNEAIAVFEPSGKFQLLNAEDGQPLVSAMLDKETKLGDIYVLAGRDHYTLLVNEALARRRDAAPVPAGGNNPTFSAQGKLYAFDRHTGKQVWDKPRQILANGIALRQPADSPVVVFVGQKSEGRGSRRQVHLLCIDRRTGREVYKEAFSVDGNPGGLQVIADVARGVVSVATKGRTIELKFTDVPPPPEAPDAAGDLQAKKSGAGSAIVAALKAIGSASQDLGTPFGGQPFDSGIPIDDDEALAPPDLQNAEEIEELDDLPPFDDAVPDEDPFGGE